VTRDPLELIDLESLGRLTGRLHDLVRTRLWAPQEHRAMTPRISLLGPAALFLFAAMGQSCPSPSQDGATQPPPATAAPSSDDVKAEMRRHFEEVTEAKNAVIDGDLDTVIELAQWIAGNEMPEDYPLAWQPHVVEIAEAAEALAQSKDIDTAAARVSRLGAGCGDCHAAVGEKPVFDDTVQPSEGDTVRARMERHQWATDRMWEGIIIPSEAAWQRGAATLPTFPGCDVSFDEQQEDLAEIMEKLCAEVSALGQRAAAARDHAERARLYGDLLGTCAACHNAGA
jgi:hypothetical protein